MSQRPGTPFDNPMGSMMDIIHGNPTTPIVKAEDLEILWLMQLHKDRQ